MNENPRTSWGGDGGHPGQDDLLVFLDGELNDKETALVGAHLDACWACRAHREKIQETINLLADYRGQVFVPHSEPPPRGWRRFAASLSRLAAESDERSRLQQLLDSFGRAFSSLRRSVLPRPFIWVSAGLVAACLAFAVVNWLDRAPIVSASELLSKSVAAQTQQLRATAQPVVYRKLRLRRTAHGAAREETLDWEIWDDRTHARLRRAVDDPQGRRFINFTGRHAASSTKAPATTATPALLGELEQVMRDNHLDPDQPLSPAAFQAWRQSLARKRDEVTRTQTAGGSEALALRTAPVGAAAVGTITEATFVVQACDWHPVTQSFVVRDERGARSYQLIETAFVVMPLKDLNPAIFAEPVEPPPMIAAAPAASPTLKRSPTPAPPAPSAAELAAAEIAARYALHRAGADLSEPLEVARLADRVEVRGLVESDERKAELLAALRDLPHTRIRVQTVAEAAQAVTAPPRVAPRESSGAQPPVAAPAESAVESAAELSAGTFTERQLARYFGATAQASKRDAVAIKAEIARLSHRAVQLSDAALAEAWALRRLAERYDAERVAELSVTDRERLTALIRAHAERLSARARELRGLLEPPLSFIAQSHSRAGNEMTGAGWQARAQAVFAGMNRVNQLTHGLFAGARLSPAQSNEQAIQSLLSALPQLERGLRALRQAEGLDQKP